MCSMLRSAAHVFGWSPEVLLATMTSCTRVNSLLCFHLSVIQVWLWRRPPGFSMQRWDTAETEPHSSTKENMKIKSVGCICMRLKGFFLPWHFVHSGLFSFKAFLDCAIFRAGNFPLSLSLPRCVCDFLLFVRQPSAGSHSRNRRIA